MKQNQEVWMQQGSDQLAIVDHDGEKYIWEIEVNKKIVVHYTLMGPFFHGWDLIGDF